MGESGSSVVTRLGVRVTCPDATPGGSGQFEAMEALAVAAERSGFDSFWVDDRLPGSRRRLDDPGGDPAFEGFSLLGALAVRTRSIGLGLYPTGENARPPALVAKLVTAVDVIARGRALLALEDDGGADGTGRERLAEVLQICRALMTEDAPSFAGRHHRIDEAPNLPRPVRVGGVPLIVVSDQGDLVEPAVRFADAITVTGDVASVRSRVEDIRQRCERIGRDPRSLSVLWSGSVAVAATHEEAERAWLARLARTETFGACGPPLLGEPVEVTERATSLYAAGIDGLVVSLAGHEDPEAMILAGSALAGLTTT